MVRNNALLMNGVDISLSAHVSVCMLQFFDDVRRLDEHLSQLTNSVDLIDEQQFAGLDVGEQLIHQLQVSQLTSIKFENGRHGYYENGTKCLFDAILCFTVDYGLSNISCADKSV